MRQLKCPQCKGHTAWLGFGYNERLGRRYKQKHCSCGYSGARRYYGAIMTFEEYRRYQEELRKRVTEALAQKLNGEGLEK